MQEICVFRVPGKMLGIRTGVADGIALDVIIVLPEGTIPEWNVANPDKAIEEGDKILKINGVVGDAQSLRVAAKKDGELHMLILKSAKSPV